MECRNGNRLSLCIASLLVVGMLAGCGGGGSGGTTTNANTGTNTTANAYTTAFTSELMNGGLFYLRGSYPSYVGQKIYNLSGSASQQLISGQSYRFDPAGVATAWQSYTQVGYYMDETGSWVSYTAPESLSDNGDGSYTAAGTIRLDITGVTDLAGQQPACISAGNMPAACATNQTYAVGSKEYTASITALMDQYDLYYQITTLTDLNGVALIALPTVGGAGYCAESSYGKYVYQLDGQTYSRYGTVACTPADISNALLGTPLTGITMVSGGRNGTTVGLIYIPVNGVAPATVDIIAQVNGVFWVGSRSNASSTPSTSTYYNRTAFDTLMTAQGLPLMP
ncbi:MAG: hypothetical protein PHH36_05360 [Sideroxydans sp.]|nr:hypothetical protein [Sideroxydans sp.]